jgi:FKBP-type peptidyl-prolyl cis-trans isomerase
MKLQTLVTLLFPCLILACRQENNKSASEQLKLETTREKFSYGLGYDFGPSLENLKSGVDIELFKRGLEDYLSGKAALVPAEERSAIRSQEFYRIGQEYIAKKLEEEQRNFEAGEAFLAQNKNKAGVITTASGLQYQVLSEGTGPQPTLNDRIKVTYRGTFIDGKEFESTEKRLGQPSTFLVKGVFPGWTEAFQLMRMGGKYRFFIPSSLAYGKIGRKPDIPPNSALIFEVELLEIVTGKE